jgi:kinesin family protein 15
VRSVRNQTLPGIANGGTKKCVTVDNTNTVFIESKPDIKSFNFDFVGDEEIGQETIFKQLAQPIADYCLEGYNGSIFAYGQTGAGKTFTIQGPSTTVNGEETIQSTFKANGGSD